MGLKSLFHENKMGRISEASMEQTYKKIWEFTRCTPPPSPPNPPPMSNGLGIVEGKGTDRKPPTPAEPVTLIS